MMATFRLLSCFAVAVAVVISFLVLYKPSTKPSVDDQQARAKLDADTLKSPVIIVTVEAYSSCETCRVRHLAYFAESGAAIDWKINATPPEGLGCSGDPVFVLRKTRYGRNDPPICIDGDEIQTYREFVTWYQKAIER